MPERDAAFAEVVGRHFDIDFVAGQDADAVFAHFSRCMREHFMPVVQFDPEHRVRKDFGYDSFKFKEVFFCHNLGYNSLFAFPKVLSGFRPKVKPCILNVICVFFRQLLMFCVASN